MSINTRAIIVVLLLISFLILTVMGLSYFLVSITGIPARLNIPPGFRLMGLFVLAIGFFLLFWVFKYRPFSDILVSTYVSINAAISKQDQTAQGQRIEPLIITGPHKFIRHPIYTAVVVILAGWWLLMDYTFLLFFAGFMTLWFNLVVAPFEERELRNIFGDQYDTYARTTPRFIPSILKRQSGKPE